MGISIVDHKIDLTNELDSGNREVKNVITATIRSTQFSEFPNIASIYYETYDQMAIDLMEKIKKDAVERFHVTDVSIIHRVGHIPLGDFSIVVSVSARRIDDAFSACKFIVEEVNSELPIWKYEVREKLNPKP